MNNSITQIVNAFAIACYGIDADIDKKFDVSFGNLSDAGAVAQVTSIVNYKRNVGGTIPSNGYRRLYILPPDFTAQIEGAKLTEAFDFDLYFTEARQINGNKDDLVRLDALRLNALQVLANVSAYSRSLAVISGGKRFEINVDGVRLQTGLNLFARNDYYVTAKITAYVVSDLACADYNPTTSSPQPIAQKYPTIANIPNNVNLTQLTFV
jgi:hypothetical protein